jgi:hypothetical protein
MAGVKTAVEGAPSYVASFVLAGGPNSPLNSLDGIDVTGIVDGSTCYVREVDAEYRYYETSVAAPVYPTVVQPLVGPGRWLLIVTPAPPGGSCAPLSRVLWVDTGTLTPIISQDGSTCTPYRTIQQALDFIGWPTSAADQSVMWTILVVPGVYDEDLTVPAQRAILIRGMGIVQLGTGAPARSVTWDNDLALGFGTLALLALEFIQVSGNVVLSDSASGASGIFSCVGPGAISGDLVATAYTGGLNISLVGGIADGSGNIGGFLNAPTANLDANGFGQINGLVTVSTYDRVVGVAFGGGITVLSGPSGGPSAGFHRCVFTGGVQTYTSPGVFRVDGTSEFSFEENDWLFAGGASYERIDDPMPRLVVLGPAPGPFILDAPRRIAIVTSPKPETVLLPPSPRREDQFVVKDGLGDASPATMLTVDGNGLLIDGSVQHSIATNYGSRTFVFNGTEWSII